VNFAGVDGQVDALQDFAACHGGVQILDPE
jgi:hypothetical protein